MWGSQRVLFLSLLFLSLIIGGHCTDSSPLEQDDHSDFVPNHILAEHGHPPGTRLASATPPPDNEEPERSPGLQLLDATARGDVDATEQLLSSGADVTTTNEHGETVLHTACITGLPEIVEMLLKAPQVSTLVNRRATATSSLRMAPLHWCVAHGFRDASALLLKAGGRVNLLCNSYGGELVTALDLAVRANRYGVVTLLESHGAVLAKDLSEDQRTLENSDAPPPAKPVKDRHDEL